MTDINRENRVLFGPYEADLHTHELWKFGTRVKLVGQPFEILAVLLSKPGELVTRDELRERLWPRETFVDFNHGLNAAVNKLRDVLCDSAENPKYIETLPRRGYRFVAAVERKTAAPVAFSSAPAVRERRESRGQHVESLAEQHPPGGLPLKRITWPYWALGLLAGSALLFALFISFLKISSATHEKMARESAMNSGPMQGLQSVVVSGGRNEGAQFSPDGTKIVYMSNRTGGRNLWVSDADGRNGRQITTIGDAGTPRWSPDGSSIAFDAKVHEFSAVFLVDRDGGALRVMALGAANNSVPSWSRDGQSIYFASDRTGRYEVWKMPVTGGSAQQVTHEGGFAAFEAGDGKTVYYSKTQFPNPDLWEFDGRAESPLPSIVRPGTWASWALNGNTIYFVQQGPGDQAALDALDLASRKMQQITLLGHFPFWLAVRPDAQSILFDQADSESTTSLVQLEKFR